MFSFLSALKSWKKNIRSSFLECALSTNYLPVFFIPQHFQGIYFRLRSFSRFRNKRPSRNWNGKSQHRNIYLREKFGVIFSVFECVLYCGNMFSPGSLCENNGRSYEKRICGTFMRRASFYWKSPAAQKKINVIFQQRQGTDLFFPFLYFMLLIPI